MNLSGMELRAARYNAPTLHEMANALESTLLFIDGTVEPGFRSYLEDLIARAKAAPHDPMRY